MSGKNYENASKVNKKEETKTMRRLVGYSQYVQHSLIEALHSKVSIRKRGKSTTKRNR